MFTVKCIGHDGNISGIECSSYSITVIDRPGEKGRVCVGINNESPAGTLTATLIVGDSQSSIDRGEEEDTYSRIVIENSSGKTVQNVHYDGELGSLSIK